MGSSPFARHYWGNGFFSSGYLDVSVPQVPIHWSMCSTSGHCWFATVGFPIRRSSDQRLYTASRGLSQCPTSFIGTWRQGIHRKLLVASPRDAEKLILFALFDKLLYRPTSSIAIQFLRCNHRLTGERRSRHFQGHRSPFNHLCLFFDTKRPGIHRRVVKNPCAALLS